MTYISPKMKTKKLLLMLTKKHSSLIMEIQSNLNNQLSKKILWIMYVELIMLEDPYLTIKMRTALRYNKLKVRLMRLSTYTHSKHLYQIVSSHPQLVNIVYLLGTWSALFALEKSSNLHLLMWTLQTNSFIET